MKDRIKIQIEFPINSSTGILYKCLSTPNGLKGWFADKVLCDEESVFTFFWKDEHESARLISQKQNEQIRFQWLVDEGEEYYFEFQLEFQELSRSVSLIVTDYVDLDDQEGAMSLWNEQVNVMMRKLGVN
ncbi:MAG: hypothetical protein RIS47_2289 [Bacteroidota bacterium]|jgi:uncharacterized protein YndB with AHSA1/START domain